MRIVTMKFETIRYLEQLKKYYSQLIDDGKQDMKNAELFDCKDELEIQIEMSQGHVSDLDKCIAYINKQ